MNKIKLMCYNIHKGRSFFTRQKVTHHIQDMIHSYNPQLVFLQEVRDYHTHDFQVYQQNQMSFLAKENYKFLYGQNCTYKNGHHGNGLLTQFPVITTENFDISVNRFEQRGVLFSKLSIGDKELYTFCTHLNLRKHDRTKQIHLLEKIIQETVPNDSCPILLLGDFNDFDGHIKTHFLGRNFQYLHQEKTFPNFFPMLRPDKIFTRNLHVHRSHIIKNRQTLLMSDHLPIIMEIEF